jgi:hypothetical protein
MNVTDNTEQSPADSDHILYYYNSESELAIGCFTRERKPVINTYTGHTETRQLSFQ